MGLIYSDTWPPVKNFPREIILRFSLDFSASSRILGGMSQRWTIYSDAPQTGPLGDVVAMLARDENPLQKHWPECTVHVRIVGPQIVLYGTQHVPFDPDRDANEERRLNRQFSQCLLAFRDLPGGLSQNSMAEALWDDGVAGLQAAVTAARERGGSSRD